MSSRVTFRPIPRTVCTGLHAALCKLMRSLLLRYILRVKMEEIGIVIEKEKVVELIYISLGNFFNLKIKAGILLCILVVTVKFAALDNTKNVENFVRSMSYL